MTSIQWARAPLSNIRPESGFAYIAPIGRPQLSSHKKPSPAYILEDGVPLPGPANALHEDIRKAGHGRFSFWYDYVYFSTPDNSNPITNGRHYEIAYPIVPRRATAMLHKIFPKVALYEPNLPFTPSEFKTAEPCKENASLAVFQYVPWQTGIWERIGLKISKSSNLLDLGCGEGACVDQFRQDGYSIFGCDFSFSREPEKQLKSYLDAGIIRTIQADPYKIPFGDNSFDLVFSHQVFEHVMDHASTLAEIRRVLRPDGFGVHIFPGRWKIRESHVYVPFASVIKSYWWLYFWALMGIRNEYQAGLSAKETASRNHKYLNEETIYLSRARIYKYVSQHFRDCRFAEEAYFYPKYEKVFMKYPFLLPLYRAWFSDTEMRLLVLGNKK